MNRSSIDKQSIDIILVKVLPLTIITDDTDYVLLSLRI